MLAAGSNPQDLHILEEWSNCYASNCYNPPCFSSDPVGLQEDGGTRNKENKSVFSLNCLLSLHWRTSSLCVQLQLV